MPTFKSDRLVPLLCLAGAVLFWGTSFVATKSALAYFTPMTVIWLRMTVATLVFVPVWFLLPRPDHRPGDLKWLALVAVLQPCLYYLAEGYAVKFTTSASAGVISAIVPLLVAVGAWLFLRERLSARSVVAIVVSLVGVTVLSWGGQAQASAPNPLLGNTLEVLAMTSAAGSMIAVKHLSARYGAWFITGLQAAVGAVFFLPGALLGKPTSWTAAPASAVAFRALPRHLRLARRLRPLQHGGQPDAREPRSALYQSRPCGRPDRRLAPSRRGAQHDSARRVRGDRELRCVR